MKTIITILLTTCAMTVMAQVPYYIYPADSNATAIALSQASGIPNPAPRCALAGDPCLIKVDPGIAPGWMSGPYEASYIRDSLLTNPLWTTIEVDSIDATDQVARARAFGNQLTLEFVARINNQVYSTGNWTLNQGLNAYNNYKDLFGLIDQGLLQMASDAIGNGTFAPLGQVTQGNLDAVKTKLDQWLTDNPLQQ